MQPGGRARDARRRRGNWRRGRALASMAFPDRVAALDERVRPAFPLGGAGPSSATNGEVWEGRGRPRPRPRVAEAACVLVPEGPGRPAGGVGEARCPRGRDKPQPRGPALWRAPTSSMK